MSTDIAELTHKLVRIDTHEPSPGGESTVARLLGELLAPAGFTLSYHEMAPGRAGLLAALPGSGERLPPGHNRPSGHRASRRDGLERGAPRWCDQGRVPLLRPGASDMKAGVVAIATAALEMARLGDRRAGLLLVFTAGEKTGSEGAQQMADSGALSRQTRTLLVAEPSGNRPFLSHKGALWLEASFRGKSPPTASCPTRALTPSTRPPALRPAWRGFSTISLAPSQAGPAHGERGHLFRRRHQDQHGA